MRKSNIQRELQFENEHICVWKTVISPGQPLDRQQNNKEGVLISLDTHKAYSLEVDPQVQKAVEVMVVEMKQPKGCTPPSRPID